MKRFAVIFFLFCMVITTRSYGMDFLLGAKAGYFVWEPYFKEMKGGGINDVDKGSGVLYGPVISVLFTPDLTLSVAGLFGKQTTHWFSPNTATTWEDQPGKVVDVSGTYFVDINRIDIDSALSYRVSDSFKLFAGYKFQRNDVMMKYTERRYPIAGTTEHVLNESEGNMITPAHGPALGVGYSRPLGSSFFASANVSIVYMWSKFEMKDFEMRTYDVPADGLDYAHSSLEKQPDVSYDTRQVGFNFEPALGAVVGNTGVVFTVSARVQYMKIEFIDEWEAAPDGWMTDLFYGGYVSVLYSF